MMYECQETVLSHLNGLNPPGGIILKASLLLNGLLGKQNRLAGL